MSTHALILQLSRATTALEQLDEEIAYSVPIKDLSFWTNILLESASLRALLREATRQLQPTQDT